MKKFIKAYSHIPATERMGIIVLLSACIILMIVWFYISTREPQSYSAAEQQQFAQAADAFLAKNTKVKPDVADSTSATLFPFDPNTLDSNGFIALSLPPKTVHALLNWRRKGKHFYNAKDLKSLYSLKPAEYRRLERYIDIKP